MKYLKKFENTVSDILQKYHVNFLKFDEKISSLESQINKLQIDIKQERNDYDKLAKKCIEDICIFYGFKDSSRYNVYTNEQGYSIAVDFSDSTIYIELYDKSFKNMLYDDNWKIDSRISYKLITIFEQIEETILQHQSKKFNL